MEQEIKFQYGFADNALGHICFNLHVLSFINDQEIPGMLENSPVISMFNKLYFFYGDAILDFIVYTN